MRNSFRFALEFGCSFRESSEVQQNVADAVLQFAKKDAAAGHGFFELRLALKALDRRCEKVGIIL